MTQPITLYLIRHGRPRAGFDEALDSGLDEVGQAQAEAIAQELSPLGPLPLVTSPLRRTRETALPFERQWSRQARIESRVGEILSPTNDLQARTAWLSQTLRGRWSDLPAAYQAWKGNVVAALTALRTTTVITTHFVALNVAVGAAAGDDRLVCFEPDYCSCTVLEVVDGRLRVVTLGRQRATTIR
ncbi:MAG: histidine phosphatase family protein [Candidatus Binatia bacterium]